MQTLTTFCRLSFAIAALIFLTDTPAFSQVTLKEAAEAPTPVGIQPFIKGAETPEIVRASSDLEARLIADLIFSRVIKVITPPENFIQKADSPLNVIQVDPWLQLGADLVARAKVLMEGNQIVLEGYIFDVATAKLRLQKTYRTTRKDITILSHQFGDDIVEAVTGRKGLFSTKIAFSYQPPRSSQKEVWVMDFNGRNPQPLVQNGRTNLSPAWSIDGRSVFFTSSSLVDWHLWKTDLNGKTKQITNFKGSVLGPAAMPNGRELVVSMSKDGDHEIYLLTLEGAVIKRLTTRTGADVSPFPSSDGKKICFSSERMGNLHVFSLDLATLEATRMTRVGTLNDSCTWNPIDNSVLFSGMDTDREFDLFAMDDKGENMERLTYDAKTNESPSFSPDGKLVAFSSRRSGRNQIYIMKADGTQVLPIELPGDASQPAWSPRLGY